MRRRMCLSGGIGLFVFYALVLEALTFGPILCYNKW